jgi:hypothetical protein
MHPALFQVFNIVFISGFQNVLLLAIVCPGNNFPVENSMLLRAPFLILCPRLEHTAYICFLSRGRPLNFLDGLSFALFLFFLTGETIADQQQWVFQCDKHERKKRVRAGRAVLHCLQMLHSLSSTLLSPSSVVLVSFYSGILFLSALPREKSSMQTLLVKSL